MSITHDHLVAHIDGSMNGIGVLLQGECQTIRISKWIGRQDTNVSEYVALLEALQYAESINAKKLCVFSDSNVVVKQMDGRYVCKSPVSIPLNFICRKLAHLLDFRISHIPREQNIEAHALAAAAAKGVA
jgi:ribonuclease HI